MSDIENRKVQDILREAANQAYSNNTSACVVVELRKRLGIEKDWSTFRYGPELQACLNEIANRIDRQSVVEVTAPAPAKDPFDEIANLYPLGACEVKFVLDSYVASGCHKVPPKPKPEPDSDQLEPAELEAMTPAIIDVHDCIIDIRIEASDD